VSPATRAPQLENEQLREKLYVWFQQWVTIFQRSHSPEKSFEPFITQLNKQGVLKVDNVASSFFRVCAESSVISYLNCVQAGDFAFAFQALDATARLIIYIVKYHGGDASEVDLPGAKAYYLKKILTIFVLVLSSMHEEEGSTFPQKPFFRFFSSLINDLHSMEAQLGPAYPYLLLALRYKASLLPSPC
jgi:CCR4-NOT transcription complex subunit 1